MITEKKLKVVNNWVQLYVCVPSFRYKKIIAYKPIIWLIIIL